MSLLCSPWLVRGCDGGSVVLPPGVCHPCVSRSWSTAVLASSSGGVTTTCHIVFIFLMLFSLQGNRLQFYLLYCIGIVVHNCMYVYEEWQKLPLPAGGE